MDSFHNTELETLLRRLGRKTLLICGVSTNLCVEATVISAVERDFNVIVLKDCTASGNQRDAGFSNEGDFSIDSKCGNVRRAGHIIETFRIRL